MANVIYDWTIERVVSGNGVGRVCGDDQVGEVKDHASRRARWLKMGEDKSVGLPLVERGILQTRGVGL